MDDENEFDLTGIFNDLTPQDFDRSNSARHVALLERQNFEEFVTNSLEALRLAFHAADGKPNPVAVLMGSDGRRIYTPDDDESVGDFLDRLSREAKEQQTHTLFIAMLTVGGTYQAPSTDGWTTLDDADAVKRSAETGSGLRPVLVWYAQYGKAVRQGIMMTEDGNTGDVFESPGEFGPAAFRAILG